MYWPGTGRKVAEVVTSQMGPKPQAASSVGMYVSMLMQVKLVMGAHVSLLPVSTIRLKLEPPNWIGAT